MNNMASVSGGAALAQAPKQESLSNTISNRLAGLIERQIGLRNNFRELETFIFGVKPPSDEKLSESPAKEDSWESGIKDQLQELAEITSHLEFIFDDISKFHR